MPAATDTLPSLSESFATIIRLLCQAVSSQGPRHPAAIPLIPAIRWRLRRLSARLAFLVALFQAGLLSAARARPSVAREPSTRAADPVPTVRLPTRSGWLLDLIPYQEVRIARCQFEVWLTQPEVSALLEAEPQAGQILRRLCRMLGIGLPPMLRLPSRKRAAASGDDGPSPQAAPLEAWWPGWLKKLVLPLKPRAPAGAMARAPWDDDPDPPPD